MVADRAIKRSHEAKGIHSNKFNRRPISTTFTVTAKWFSLKPRWTRLHCENFRFSRRWLLVSSLLFMMQEMQK